MQLSLFFFRKFLFSKNAGSITKTISWLCMLGVMVSVTTMVVVMSVMSGFGEAIEDRLLNFEPHIVIKSISKDPRISKNELSELEKKLRKNAGIDSGMNAFLFDQEQIILRTPAGHYSGAIAKGLEEKSLEHFIEASRQFNQEKIKKFSWDQKIESPLIIDNDDVIVGADLAYQTGIFIGDQIVLSPPEALLLPPGEVPPFVKMNVQDITRTNLGNVDSQIIVYKKRPGKLFKDAISLESLLEVYLMNPAVLNEIISRIDVKKFQWETWRDRNSSLFYSLKMEKMLIGFFLFLAFMIGSFTIVTVLILLATQKQKDIGVLLTLGMKRRRIIKIFTHIGFLLSGSGIFMGFVLGLLICFVLSNYEIFTLPDVYYDRTIPVQFDLKLYAAILGVSFIVSYLSSRYPARLISSFQIQDILLKKN